MEIQIDIRLTVLEVNNLPNRFDNSSDIPLHEGSDFVSYSEKLSKKAHFILIKENGEMMGFIAYYLNEEGRFAYVPQVVVHREGRHKGLGHKMFAALEESLSCNYDKIQLEVLKSNHNARNFYEREGFIYKEDRNERILLCKNIKG